MVEIPKTPTANRESLPPEEERRRRAFEALDRRRDPLNPEEARQRRTRTQLLPNRLATPIIPGKEAERDRMIRNGIAPRTDEQKRETLKKEEQKLQKQINPYIADLKKRVTATFKRTAQGGGEPTREFFVSGSGSPGATILAMLEDAEQNAVSGDYGNKIINNVALAEQSIIDLERMQFLPNGQRRTDLREPELRCIEEVKAFFRAMKTGDIRPESRTNDRITNALRKTPYALKQGKGAARFTLLLGATAVFLFGAFLDIKNKHFLKPITLMWLAIAAGISGLFRGDVKKTLEQVGPCLNSEWEAFAKEYSITGQHGVNVIKAIWKGKEDKPEETAQLLAGKITPQQYINLILPESRGGSPGSRTAVRQTLLAIAGRQARGKPGATAENPFVSLVRTLSRISTEQAQDVFLTLTKKGVTSTTVAQELTKKTPPPTPRPAPNPNPNPKTTPSSSVPSGTPPASPLIV